VKQAGVQAVELSDKIEISPGNLSIGTMGLAKGLELRAVSAKACDDEVIPLQERIENVADMLIWKKSTTVSGTSFTSHAPVPATISW
jgi:hypothetical protein